jgi:hypothetical protein
VVTKVFGLRSEQYEAMRDALDDVGSNDRMGIYQHKGNPQQYVIVLRLPNRDKFETLELGATAGAGVGLGVLGKMLTNQGVWNAQRDTWFEVVKNFMLYSQAFEQNFTELKNMLFKEEEMKELENELPINGSQVLLNLKSQIFAWEFNNFSGASEDKYREIARRITPSLNLPRTAFYIADSKFILSQILSIPTRDVIDGTVEIISIEEAQDRALQGIPFAKYLSRLTTPA